MPPVCSVEEFRPQGQPEQELFSNGATREVWHRCSVVALFAEGTEVAPVLERLQALLALPPLRFEAGAHMQLGSCQPYPAGPGAAIASKSLCE